MQGGNEVVVFFPAFVVKDRAGVERLDQTLRCEMLAGLRLPRHQFEVVQGLSGVAAGAPGQEVQGLGFHRQFFG